MPRLVDVLNSNEFRKLSIGDQDKYLQGIGISRQQAADVEGVEPFKEPSFLQKTGRALIRSLATAGETIAAIPLYDNIENQEELSNTDSTAIRVLDYLKKVKEENPSLATGKEGAVAASALDAAESLGTSLAFSAPTYATSFVFSPVAGAAVAVPTFEAQRRGTAVTTYFDLVRELEQKEGKLSDTRKREVWDKAAKLSGLAEAGFEAVGNIAGGLITKKILGHTVKSVGGKEALKQIFEKPFSTTLKQGAKAYVVDQAVSEQPSEILTSLVQNKYARENVGLESQFLESLPRTIGSTAFLGGGMTSVATVYTALQDKSTASKVKDTIFNGIDTESYTPDERDSYMKSRIDMAHGVSELVRADLGDEAADNFLNNIVEATKVSIDPEKPGTGAVPYNESIFTKNPVFTNTVQPNQSNDIDILGDTRQSIRDPKQALDPEDVKSAASAAKKVDTTQVALQQAQDIQAADNLRQERLKHEGEVDPKLRQQQLNAEAWDSLKASHTFNIGPKSTVTLTKVDKTKQVKYTLTTPKGRTTELVTPLQAASIRDQANQDADVHATLLEQQEQNRLKLKAGKQRTQGTTTKTTNAPVQQVAVPTNLPQYSQFLINEANNGTLNENSFEDYFTKQDPNVVASEMQALGIPLTGDAETDNARKIQYGEIALKAAGPHLQQISQGRSQQQPQQQQAQVPQTSTQVAPSVTPEVQQKAPESKQEQVVQENSSQAFEYIDSILAGAAIKLGEEKVRGDLVTREDSGKVVLDTDVEVEGFLTDFNNKKESSKARIIDKYIDVTYQTVAAAMRKGYLTLSDSGEVRLADKKAAEQLRNWIVSNEYLADVANKIGKDLVSSIKKSGSEYVAFSIKEGITDKIVDTMLTPDAKGNYPSYTFEQLVALAEKIGNETGLLKKSKKSAEATRILAARYASIIREMAAKEIFVTTGNNKAFTLNESQFTAEEAKAFYNDNYESVEGTRSASDPFIDKFVSSITKESDEDTRSDMPEKVNARVVSIESRIDELSEKETLTREEDIEVTNLNNELNNIAYEYGDTYKLREKKQLEAIKVKAINLKGLRTTNPKMYISNRLYNIISYFLEYNQIKLNLEKEGILSFVGKVSNKETKLTAKRKESFKDVKTFLQEAAYIYANPEALEMYVKKAKQFNINLNTPVWKVLDETIKTKPTSKQLLTKSRDINKIAKFIQKVNIVAYDYFYKPSNALSKAFDNINKDLSFADLHLYDQVSEAFNNEMRSNKRVKELIKAEMDKNAKLTKAQALEIVNTNLDKELLSIFKETNVWAGGNSSTVDWLIFKDFVDYVSDIKKIPHVSTEFLTEIQYYIAPEVPTSAKKVRRNKKTNKFEFVTNDFRQETNYKDVEDYIKSADIPAEVADKLRKEFAKANAPVSTKERLAELKGKRKTAAEKLYEARQLQREQQQIEEENQAAAIEEKRQQRIEQAKIAQMNKVEVEKVTPGKELSAVEKQIPSDVVQDEIEGEEGEGVSFVTTLLDQNGEPIGEPKVTRKRLQSKKDLKTFEEMISDAQEEVTAQEETTKVATPKKVLKKAPPRKENITYSKDSNGVWTAKSNNNDFVGMGITKAEAKQELLQEIAADNAMRERINKEAAESQAREKERKRKNKTQVFESITGILNEHDKGNISSDSAIDKVLSAIEDSDKNEEDAVNSALGIDRERGYTIIVDALSKEVLKGNISKDAFTMIKWFLDKNKQMAKELALEIKNAENNRAAAKYVPSERLVILFKEYATGKDVIHEVFHHLEILMPRETRNEVRKVWMTALLEARNEAAKDINSKARLTFFDSVIDQMLTHETIKGRYHELFQKGILTIDDYKLISPSEYWATKMADKTAIDYNGSLWNKTKQWISEVIEKIKSVLGLSNNHAMYKAFNDIVKGDIDNGLGKMLTKGVTFNSITNTAVPKYTSLSKIKGILEEFSIFKKFAKNNTVLPTIQALTFNEEVETKMSAYVHKDSMDPKLAHERAIKEVTLSDKNGPTARTLYENHLMKTNQSDSVYYMATSVENGKLINHFENAVEAHNQLSTKERNVLYELTDQGNIDKVEYTNIDDAIEGYTKRIGASKTDITSNVYTAYLAVRKAMINAFTKKNMLFFNSILDDIIDGVVPADKIDVVKDILTKHIYKKPKSRKERLNRIKDALFEAGLTKKQYDTIIENLTPMIGAARRALKFYVDGGVAGAVTNYRKSKADNPFVVRIFETREVPVEEGSTETKKVRSLKYATFFPTNATMQDFVSRIKTDNDLKSLFTGEDINVDNFKKSDGSLDISAKKEVNAVINNMFSSSDDSRLATNSMLDDVINSIKQSNDGDVSLQETADKIKHQIIARANLAQIRTANAQFMRRKGKNIRGYDLVNPITVLQENTSQFAGFLARKEYVKRLTDYALSEQGDRRIEATKLIQESFVKYRDSDNMFVRASAAIANAATVSFMTYRIVTATTQAHQYFLFGMGELTGAGASYKEAMQILSSNYIKLSLVRLGISATDLRKHLMGDKMAARTLRAGLPAGGYKFITDALNTLAYQEKTGTQKDSKFYNVTLLEDERALLARHRNNNDVSDNLTKELNTFEWSEKEALGYWGKTKDAVGGIANLGMMFFNEMEVLNREASLLSMYQFRRKQGDTTYEADVKATNFMHRVNGDFNAFNKIELLRKYPVLSSVFALTGYAFHASGLLGYRLLQTMGLTKSKRTFKQNFRGMLAYVVMAGLLGGAKGEPLWDWFNKLYSMIVGKNVMLEWETAAKSGNPDVVVQKMVDFAFRGAPALLDVDWSSNVALRPPLLDSIMDIKSYKSVDLGKTGAGLAWATGLAKAAVTAWEGDKSTVEGASRTFKRAVEDLNVGGISQWLRSERYKDEGYTTATGTPMYVGDKPRKLSDREATIYKTGFKTLDTARTQDVVNDQVAIGKNYWENKRKGAMDDYFKLVSPYINRGVDIPPSIKEKADKVIMQFNKRLSLASKGVMLSVDPINGDTIVKSAINRYKPTKKTMGYHSMYSDLLDTDSDEE